MKKVGGAHPTWLPGCPIRRVRPVCHEAVKARIGPVRHAGDVAVFDGIVMEVVAVNIEIPLIADRMFPEPALLDAPASIAVAGIRQRLFVAARRSVTTVKKNDPPGI